MFLAVVQTGWYRNSTRFWSVQTCLVKRQPYPVLQGGCSWLPWLPSLFRLFGIFRPSVLREVHSCRLLASGSSAGGRAHQWKAPVGGVRGWVFFLLPSQHNSHRGVCSTASALTVSSSATVSSSHSFSWGAVASPWVPHQPRWVSHPCSPF